MFIWMGQRFAEKQGGGHVEYSYEDWDCRWVLTWQRPSKHSFQTEKSGFGNLGMYRDLRRQTWKKIVEGSLWWEGLHNCCLYLIIVKYH